MTVKNTVAMSIRLEISAERGFLRIRSTGKYSLAEAKRTFVEMLEAMAQRKIGKVLFDGRKLVGNPRLIERFFYSEFAAQTVLKFSARGGFPATQFAYVILVPMRDPAKFGETVAVNRGMNLKVFEDPDEALGWLGIAPGSKQKTGADE
jgi:hypothetical protein